MVLDPQREAFLERLRLQLEARYTGLEVEAEPARFAVRLRGAGLDTSLPLTPLYEDCLRAPSRTPRRIIDFVNAAAGQLARRAPGGLSLSRVLWCVRTAEYLEDHSGAPDLLTAPVAGPLVAFAAES